MALRSGGAPIEPVYCTADAEGALKLFRRCRFDATKSTLAGGFR